MNEFRWIDSEDILDRKRLVVEWMLGSVCNYQCAYCPPRLRDGQVKWPSPDSVLSFCQRIIQNYSGKEITFLFTGGEPTLYPHLIRIAQIVREQGAKIVILSNGSRPADWWREAVNHLDQVILSFHIKEANPTHFLETITQIRKIVPVQVNLMMDPTTFNKCLNFGKELEELFSEVKIHYKPILDNWKQPWNYKKEEMLKLSQLNCHTVEKDGRKKVNFLKGNLRRYRMDGTSEVVTPTELILKAENQWEGWECSIGLENLFIRWDEVFRGTCGVGGSLGFIHDVNIVFPNLPTSCDQKVCNCIGGIKATKRLPEKFP